jgi:6,7-dimethyl-8-ribityllumazine synthase
MSEPGHYLIVEARFYDDMADALVAGAIEALEKVGATFDRISVPGAFEVPAAISMAETGQKEYDGYIALGVVIRGETSHYDYVCGESARGLMNLGVDRHLAIGYGILTVENKEQAWARINGAKGNKGVAAAEAALAMHGLKKSFHP